MSGVTGKANTTHGSYLGYPLQGVTAKANYSRAAHSAQALQGVTGMADGNKFIAILRSVTWKKTIGNLFGLSVTGCNGYQECRVVEVFAVIVTGGPS